MIWLLIALSFWTQQVDATVIGGYRTFEECRAAGEGAERPLGTMLPLDRTVMICFGTNGQGPK